MSDLGPNLIFILFNSFIMIKSKFYFSCLVIAFVFGGAIISGFSNVNVSGTDLKAASLEEGKICCNIDAEPVPPICYTQTEPIVRDFYGVQYPCFEG